MSISQQENVLDFFLWFLKFSDLAFKWSTIDKECFGIFYSIFKLSYYLRGKHFTIMTDHANLKWMEISVVDRIVRMRMFMQNFDMDLLHFKGKLNRFADWLSRMGQERAASCVMLLDLCLEDSCSDIELCLGVEYENSSLLSEDQLFMYDESGMLSAEADDLACVSEFPEELVKALDELASQNLQPKSLKEAFDLVHNGRMGHHGAKRTWLKLSKVFPGHTLTTEIIQDFIDRCPICQKLGYDMSTSLQAPIRALNLDNCRHFVGFDTLTVTPVDANGYCCIHVVKQLPSRLVGIYPARNYSAEGVARALFSYFVTYGISEVMVSDPGSNITARVVQLLLKWFGVRFRMSLVNRHESNMVERSNRELLRFLSALVHDERLENWSDPECYLLIQFILNDEISSETGLSPFEFTFGTMDSKYFHIPDSSSDEFASSTYISNFNDNLKAIRKIACEVQKKIQNKRMSKTPAEKMTQYQPGQLVLFKLDVTKHKPSKLYPRFKGPYEVVSTYKADVICTHLVMRFDVTLHMSWLKPFFGSKEEAFRIAMIDYRQFSLDKVVAYRGDPEKRTTMDFRVLFSDQSLLWMPYSTDLATSEAFHEYIFSVPELFPLRFSAKEAVQQKTKLKKCVISTVIPGDVVFVNLRAWGADFYDALELPNAYDTLYVVQCVYKRWAGRKRITIDVYCSLFNSTFEWSAYDVQNYGTTRDFNPDTMVLVDSAFCARFPNILS